MVVLKHKTDNRDIRTFNNKEDAIQWAEDCMDTSEHGNYRLHTNLSKWETRKDW